MLNGCYYLNNNGSRWVVYANGQKEKVTLETKSGELITRTAIFYESFGNFGLVCISYKGKKIKVFPDSLLDD
jgi:hypothetical protein